MTSPEHPVLQAIGPLLSRVGAAAVDPAELQPQDVPLVWEGAVIAGIRLAETPPGEPPTLPDPAAAAETTGGLDGIIAEVERHFGTPLAELTREGKQQAVRMFEEGGAFSYRKSVETVAAALGVSRFTVYNYLNRDRD